MSGNLVIITGVIYACIAIEQSLKGNTPVSLMFFGYAFANIGIYFQTT